MWLYQIRFTPVSAVRTISWVRGDHVETVKFTGGAGVLLAEGDRYHAYVACRWGWLLWRPCGGTSLTLSAGEKEPIAESASWTALGKEGSGVSVLVGRAFDERVDRIVWQDQEYPIPGDRHFFFVRRTASDEMFARAAALSREGKELYEWSPATFYDWQPVVMGSVAFPDRPGPASWYLPVPSDLGNWSVTGGDPLDVARRFVGECDCKEVSARVLKTEAERSTYLVRQEEVRDDSIRHVSYLVELDRTGANWQVTKATYFTECRRGVSQDGYCQ